MLHTSLGLEVIEPSYPMMGLGAYTEAPASGDCSADFRCGPHGSVTTCRPCNAEILAVYKSIQTDLNRIVIKLGIGSAYLLSPDGSFGPKTMATIGAVAYEIQDRYSPPPAAIAALQAAASDPSSLSTMRAVAAAADSLGPYMGSAASALEASTNLPAPPPLYPGTGGKAPAGGAKKGPIGPPQPLAHQPKAGMRAAIGILAGLTTVGLVGAGIYYSQRVKF